MKETSGASALIWVDRLAEWLARLGDLLVIAIALMLFGEVVARYAFSAPTIWTQDVAITLQVWFTYLGMAYVLRRRELIRITAVIALLGPRLRQLAEGFALVVILLFSLVATIYGWDVVSESIRSGRRQPTILELPNWVAELPVIVGFALLALQSLAELIRLPFRPAPMFTPGGEHATKSNEP
ncbi:TRAP-type mannitol/chloroaromatic compound transport system, small permease component [Modicisalibacter ilicicola DSM 19980]|uniref:TRAP transporter small permease protein n=1 Tax=Modicisalibacter ilicicola DSM 19980 TaxID=1121942 RepID=A0A1M5D4Y1_9GAMM|nr:TRAP transporter small permease [Halomonas ilicicola]SHF61907.1 TRAP-type mannitol/chloroaromatic compound transport system, small permease component [Halomonas ilicicola DSM 19980]